MLQSWRWFGENDPVPLSHVRQAGVDGIVTALHHVPNGEVWSVDEIVKRKTLVEKYSMTWAVVESVFVHESIKTRSAGYATHIENYKQTLHHLAQCGIKTVCYNFMPVVDWTRTDLGYEMPDGARALRFDADRFGVFEIYLLQRPGAEDDYTDTELQRIHALYASMDDGDKDALIKNIIAGLPGAAESYGIADIKRQLSDYDGMDRDDLRHNLRYFLQQVTPVAEELDIKLCIHPDDPPRSVLGLPRIVSTADDVRYIFDSYDSYYNGLTYCTGSFGVRADNDVVAMAHEFAPRIHFAHLRTTKRENNPRSFHEAPHLEGDVPMVQVMDALLTEHHRRVQENHADPCIPFRPDHGHQMLDDLDKITNPGYSAIGRLRGLAELRGIMQALNVTKFS